MSTEEATNKRVAEIVEVEEGPQKKRPKIDDHLYTELYREFPVEEKSDIYRLDSENTDYKSSVFQGYKKKIQETVQRDETLRLFARNIASFRNGDKIMKHCGPWGASVVLHNTQFQIERKIFEHECENLVAVILRSFDDDTFYEIDEPFFEGWTDVATRKLYYDSA